MTPTLTRAAELLDHYAANFVLLNTDAYGAWYSNESSDAHAEMLRVATDLRAMVEAETRAPEQAAEPSAQGLGEYSKRVILDAIRSAYDIGYNDARNARTVPGDLAPGYTGRQVEADHGGALIAALDRIAARPPDVARLVAALQFYAEKRHFVIGYPDAWDTVSGEPPNIWCDEAGTATVEDGSVARAALAANAVLDVTQAAIVADGSTDADQPWERNDELTLSVLYLVGGHSVPLSAIKQWTDQQCREAEEWAGAVHLHASDNDDVVIPPKPLHVAAHPEQPDDGAFDLWSGSAGGV